MKRAGILGEAGDDVGSESDDDDVAAASDVREGATLAEVRHHHFLRDNARTHNSPPRSPPCCVNLAHPQYRERMRQKILSGGFSDDDDLSDSDAD